MKNSKILSCIVTGIEKRVFNLKKKVGKYGSIEELERFFVCKEAVKLLKQRVSPEAVQEKLLPKNKKPFHINLEVLAKLKLLKKQKKKDIINLKRTPEELERIKQQANQHLTSQQAYIEWMTGGPNNCQVEHGGTCFRPDILLENNKCCDPCPYVKYCLCKLKKLAKR